MRAMCANTNLRRSAPLLPILFYLLISPTILTVGLPIQRQEHASGSDLIAGEAFLSILMGAADQPANLPDVDLRQQAIADADKTFGLKTPRTSRNSKINYTPSNQIHKLPSVNIGSIYQTSDSDLDTTPSIQIRNEIDNIDNRDNDTEEGTIISVRVSSSVGHSMINKHIYTNKEHNEELEENAETRELPTTTISNILTDELIEKETEQIVGDQEAIASEDAPSLVAESNKSEFHVDEMEPISRDYDNPLPNPSATLNPASPIPFNGKTYPGTVIYHNDANSNNNARSVSYSTVIQALPSLAKEWHHGDHNPQLNRTMEVPKASSPQSEQGHARNTPQVVGSGAETKDYYVTSKYEEPSRYYSPEPTERNWGIPEQNYHEPSKPYTPIVYGQPEQNYEVDEAVSVETNGRAHGIQPVIPSSHSQTSPEVLPNVGTQGNHATLGKLPSGKKDDNQKVGYVVEGRNYRKYRVEERTSDGFIVGEYGVVRHDDGSLRGVRYTADGTISPRLIYDALMKFLSL